VKIKKMNDMNEGSPPQGLPLARLGNAGCFIPEKIFFSSLNPFSGGLNYQVTRKPENFHFLWRG